MGFREGSFGKIWSVENKGNYSVAEMSTSKKNKQTDKYETDWSNKFVRLIGTAAKQVEGKEIPKGGLSVKIGQCEVTNNYDKEKKITYTNYAIFNFHEEEENGKPNNTKSSVKPNTKASKPAEEKIDEDLPF